MDNISFSELYTQYYKRSFLFAKSYVRDEMAAEDIASESLIQLWETLKRETVNIPLALLTTILKNKALNYLKHQSVEWEAKEKNDIREYATEKLVMELLPVLDNFERALAASAEDDPAGYAKGMELIFTQMVTELQKSGLAEVEAEGQDFDPTKHNAVMTEENEELESGKVSKVLQKGYALNDKVIRPSMVAVTK